MAGSFFQRSADEKTKWINDLRNAIENHKILFEEKQSYASLKSNSELRRAAKNSHVILTRSHVEDSSDNNLDESNVDEFACNSDKSAADADSAVQQHRSNSTIHVCWHRNISVSAYDLHQSTINQLSGYLLRKFKNSNGWQKLWVVFTNFCLFFYKTYQVNHGATRDLSEARFRQFSLSKDEHPLASLPLLGYTVSFPSETDNVIKDYVFKLQFKNHVYFFRTDNQHSLERYVFRFCYSASVIRPSLIVALFS
jgi:FERM/RhoGEF/pleckstrin domain protein 2